MADLESLLGRARGESILATPRSAGTSLPEMTPRGTDAGESAAAIPRSFWDRQGPMLEIQDEVLEQYLGDEGSQASDEITR